MTDFLSDRLFVGFANFCPLCRKGLAFLAGVRGAVAPRPAGSVGPSGKKFFIIFMAALLPGLLGRLAESIYESGFYEPLLDLGATLPGYGPIITASARAFRSGYRAYQDYKDGRLDAVRTLRHLGSISKAKLRLERGFQRKEQSDYFPRGNYRYYNGFSGYLQYPNAPRRRHAKKRFLPQKKRLWSKKRLWRRP